MPERWIDRLRGLRFRAKAVLRPDAAWQDLDDELRFHVEMEAERLRREGAPPKEARRRAMILFGGVNRFSERTREARGTKLVEDVMQDRFTSSSTCCAGATSSIRLSGRDTAWLLR